MISAEEADQAVLAALRGGGPGPVTVKQLSSRAGLPRVTVRTSITALALDGLICLFTDDDNVYQIRHLHAVPGPCGHSLGCVITEDC